MGKTAIFIALFLFSVIGCSSLNTTNLNHGEKVACDALIESFGNSPLLALGETHGTYEFSKFKVDCIKRLVSENHFNLLAIEADFVGTSCLNDFIQYGEGNPKELVQNLNYIFSTGEFLDLVAWLRNYHTTTKQKIDIVGVDFQSKRIIVTLLKSYFKKWDPSFLKNLENVSGKDVYQKLVKLGKNDPKIEKSAFYPYALKVADLLMQNDQFNSKHEQLFRDQQMAKNLDWHLRQSFQEPRAIFWAHNFHIAHDNKDGHSTTYYLEKEFKRSVKSLGLFFGSGSYLAATLNEPSKFQIWNAQEPVEGSIEFELARSLNNVSFLSFGNNDLFKKDALERGIGWAKQSKEFFEGDPLKEFDSAVYFPKSTPLKLVNY